MPRAIRDTDRGYAALLQRVLQMKRPRIAVGVHAAEGSAAKKVGAGESASMATVVDIAAWAEFGIGQPERSWLRAWYDATHRAAFDDIRSAMLAVLKGSRSLDQSIEVLGQRFVGQIQVRIAQGIAPPNAPSTIAKKGSSKPLIDTGQFRTSITYSVRINPPR